VRSRPGRHFLHIPGPTTVPDRVMRAMSRPVIDHRGAEFAALGAETLEGMKRVFKTSGPVVIFPSSATGAWEAALANSLSPGDRVLMFETGHFATLWRQIAERLGLDVVFVAGDWRRGVSAQAVESALAEDAQHKIKAVCCVHNETSTGVVSDISSVRRAMNAARHPALLMVDTVSSLATMDYSHDEWGVDVSVSGSQKGLMLPPGLSFNALSDKALAAAKTARSTRSYWRWEEMIGPNRSGFFPFTPATTLLYGLREALAMLDEEGLAHVFARHARHAAATRAAVRAWGLEVLCAEPAEYSASLTAVLAPNADGLRETILDRFDLSLGGGLGKLRGQVFRIGHLGSLNDLMLAGALCGVEMGLALTRTPHRAGGVQAALAVLGAPEALNLEPVPSDRQMEGA
jgi:alanine-glyoxylate transaminase/serine-glyoxylate transaminase/serine-pyruvate transaminase